MLKLIKVYILLLSNNCSTSKIEITIGEHNYDYWRENCPSSYC